MFSLTHHQDQCMWASHVKHKWISLDLTSQNRPTESSYVWYYLGMIKPQILYITLVLLSTARKLHVWSVNNLVISQTLKYNDISYTKKKAGYFCGLLLQLSTNSLPRHNYKLTPNPYEKTQDAFNNNYMECNKLTQLEKAKVIMY